MLRLKPLTNGNANYSEFDGIISEKQSSILSLTKVVVALSIFLAILMLVLR